MKFKSALVLAVLAMFGLAACDSPLMPTEKEVTVAITTSLQSMSIGQKSIFSATVGNDTTGSLQGVTWSSSTPAVASVNATTGEVTALAAGLAAITATSKYRPTKAAAVQVTVQANAPLSLPVLGTGSVTERYTAEIAAGNGFAYTTTWSTRSGNRGDAVKIWNISGATPALVDSLKILGVGTTSDVQISPDGSLLVVSTEGLSTGSIVVYNRTNPGAPTFVSRFQTPETVRGVHTVKLSVINGKLYAFLQINPSGTTPAGIVIVDLSNPAVPMQVFAQLMGRPYIHDVFVRDGILFTALWNDGMTIFDVGGGGRGGSPSNPVLISNIRTVTGQIHNIWWFQDPTNASKKYVFLGEEGPSNGSPGPNGLSSGDIHVIDVSNLAAPKEVAVYTLGNQTGTHNFVVDEPSGILYAAYYNGGVRALDIRGDLGTCTTTQRSLIVNVAGERLCDLKLMGREAGNALTSTYYIWGVAMVGSRLYASDMAKGIVALDISGLKR